MKYYIVALFDDESYKCLNPIQRNFSKKFKANRNSPIPHIILEVIENPNVDKLDPLITKIMNPYKKFKVEIEPNVFICEANKTVALSLQDKGYIKRLSRLISETLKLHGFSMKSFDMPTNVSLANLNYVNRDLKKGDGEVTIQSAFDTLKVNRIELWKISNNKRETLIKTYHLKDF